MAHLMLVCSSNQRMINNAHLIHWYAIFLVWKICSWTDFKNFLSIKDRREIIFFVCFITLFKPSMSRCYCNLLYKACSSLCCFYALFCWTSTLEIYAMLYRPCVAFILRKCTEDSSQNFQDGIRYVNQTSLYIFTKGTM